MAKPMLVCLDDYEKYAIENLDGRARTYYTSGADEEISLKENRRAFQRLKIIPRVLRDVSNRELFTTVLGHRIDFPVCISPTGIQRMACDEGEIATARAARAMKTCMVLSTGATRSLEEVSQAAQDGIRWFQLYVHLNRVGTEELVKRAEASGFKALVLTVDAPFVGKRRRHGAGFVAPPHMEQPHLQSAQLQDAREKMEKQELHKVAYLDPSLTWTCISWLKSITTLPIIVKGILSPADALLAVRHGVAGIVVSNHGGRQLDGVPATIEALPKIVEAVNGEIEIYVDGGVRTGTDVFKALALGAKAVFVGRPILYGLSYAGEEGVRQVLQILKDELSLAMALSGCAKISDIKPEYVVHESYYARL